MYSRGFLKASLANNSLSRTSFSIPQKFSSLNKYGVRGFTDAKPETLVLTFAVPHEVFVNQEEVHSVRVPGVSGEFGILPNHVPTISQLKPGVVGIIKKEKDGRLKPEEEYFVSGGFAFVHRDSTCSVNAIEAVPLSHLDPDAAKAGFQKYQQAVISAGNEEDKTKAMVGLEVHQAMCAALKIGA